MSVYSINQKLRAVPTPGTGRPPSDRQVRVAEMFGIGLDETYEVTLYAGLVLDIRPGDLAFITGPSGSGKSVLLANLVRAIRRNHPDRSHIVDLATLHPASDRPVIDLLEAPLEAALHCLSTAGLADAFVLLRPASELSDGQRYRLRLALALDRLLAEGGAGPATPGHSPAVSRSLRVRPSRGAANLPRPEVAAHDLDRILVADEFCSALDRLCARALAYRLRRLVDRHGLTVLAASAHDDLVEDLAPDVLVTKDAGSRVEVRYADPSRGASTPSRDREHTGMGLHREPQPLAADISRCRKLAATGGRGSRPGCTLLAGVHIEPGTMADWHAMAPLHYRSHHAGAVTNVFRMVYGPARTAQPCVSRGLCPRPSPGAAESHPGERTRDQRSRLTPGRGSRLRVKRRVLVGVIVYARPALSLAARDRATAGRYRTAGLPRTSMAQQLNREVRVISRVVIAPNWRGLGLAARLVAETMPTVGTPYVEALAAMGHVHPFFERAGMTAYPQGPSPAGERLKAALETAGIGRTDRRSAAALETALSALPPPARRLAEREIRRWALSYLGAKNHRTNRPDRERTLALVARHLDATPVYYLWRRKENTPCK